MSGRAGVRMVVKSRHDFGGGKGNTVCVLKCGHAVLRYSSDAKIADALVCDICSREQARVRLAAKPDADVREAVKAAMKENAAKVSALEETVARLSALLDTATAPADVANGVVKS